MIGLENASSDALELILKNPAVGEVGKSRVRAELERRGRRARPGTAVQVHELEGFDPRIRMNKTERAYAAHLDAQPDVVKWWFEAMRFVLAPKTSYTPDFLVLYRDGRRELHEVKGFWRDDARVKIKIAAASFPFTFLAVQRDGGGWKVERFGGFLA